jgi:hypothetical protein
MTKSWYTSKVVWVNVVTTIALVVDVLTAGMLIPAGALPYIAAGVAILNIILRVWFVEKPIA